MKPILFIAKRVIVAAAYIIVGDAVATRLTNMVNKIASKIKDNKKLS